MISTIVSKDDIVIQIWDKENEITVDFNHPNMSWVPWFRIKNGKFSSECSADESWIRDKLEGLKTGTKLDEWLGTDSKTREHIRDHTTYVDEFELLGIYEKGFVKRAKSEILDLFKKDMDVYFKRDGMYWHGSIEKVYKRNRKKIIGCDVYIY